MIRWATGPSGLPSLAVDRSFRITDRTLRWSRGPSGLPFLAGDRSYCLTHRMLRWSRGPSGLPPLRGDRSYCVFDRMLRWFPPRSGLPDRTIRWYTGSSGVHCVAREGYLNSSSLSPTLISSLRCAPSVLSPPPWRSGVHLADPLRGTSHRRSEGGNLFLPFFSTDPCEALELLRPDPRLSKVCSVLPFPFLFLN